MANGFSSFGLEGNWQDILAGAASPQDDSLAPENDLGQGMGVQLPPEQPQAESAPLNVPRGTFSDPEARKNHVRELLGNFIYALGNGMQASGSARPGFGALAGFGAALSAGPRMAMQRRREDRQDALDQSLVDYRNQREKAENERIKNQEERDAANVIHQRQQAKLAQDREDRLSKPKPPDPEKIGTTSRDGYDYAVYEIPGRPDSRVEIKIGPTKPEKADQSVSEVELEIKASAGDKQAAAALKSMEERKGRVAKAGRSPGSPPLVLVQTVDEKGNPVTRIVPKVAGAEYSSKPTAEQINRKAASIQVFRGIEAIEKIGNSIITKVGPAQRVDAAVRGVKTVFGNDPGFKTYQDSRVALAGNLAVSQQGSRPSDADILRVWLPLVPDAYSDTSESSKMKWDLIKTLSKRNSDNESPGAAAREAVRERTGGSKAQDLARMAAAGEGEVITLSDGRKIKKVKGGYLPVGQ